MDDLIYHAQNTWKQGKIPDPPKLHRGLFEIFEEDLGRPEILVLMGARQTGKTTLLMEMARRALVGGRVTPDLLHYLDLDTMRCEDVLESNRSLIDFLGMKPGKKNTKPVMLFIDEIQRLETPGLFLKSVFDLGLPLKIAVTGSSSLELRSRIRESLAGRSIRHYLWPLEPGECKDREAISLDEYYRWGGFPAVVLGENDAERQRLLANLLASYLDRDIGGFLRVDNIRIFTDFLQLLAGQIGQLVNLNELANTLDLSRDTLARYLVYLENTFMVRVLRPFIGNRRSEITKMPKVYFSDLGFRNLLARRLGSELTTADRGPILENIVEILLRLDPRTEDLHFWRTRGGAEVDFIWQVGGEHYAIEVKASKPSKPQVSRSMGSFIKEFAPKRAAVVAPGAVGTVHRYGTPVLFIPPEAVTTLADDS